MSAFDITGAILSFIFICLSWAVCKHEIIEESGFTPVAGFAPVIFLVSLVWFIFCVARLFGAHL